MSAAEVAINIAAQFTGKNAFQKADKATQGLQRSVKSLGRSLGIALGTAAIVNFGKQSVKAFAADDNAARSLAKTLENLGLNTGYAGQELNGYISRLEKQTGVLDDELRPAMDRLLRATGDVTKSQELLGLALDISAGTGKDLTIVSQSLQKALLGNNASLGRLGVGLTKAELTTSSFLEIQSRLTQLFAGQATDAANSFQGSLNKLTVASNNAKEAIGKGLVDALATLTGGGGSIDAATGVIDKIAAGIAEGAKNIAFMIKQFESLKPVIIAIGALLLLYFAPVTAAIAALTFLLAKGGSNLKKSQFAQGKIPQGMGNISMTGGSNQDTQRAQTAAKKKADADALKLQKSKNALAVIDNANTTRKLVLTADQQALEELKKKFDVERIGLFSALNQATDEETRMRLKSLIAIHDNDTALAGKIKAELEAAEAARLLALALAQSLTAWGNWQTLIGNSFAAAAMAATSPVPITPTPSMPSPSYAPGDIPGISGQRGFRFAGADSSPTVIVNVAGSISTERDLVSAITQGIYNNQASGIPISYSTSYV